MIRPARSNSLASVVFNLAMVLAFSGDAFTQEAARPSRGAALNRNYAISDIENINLQNGNLQLSIPLAALPPIAGGKLSFTVSANYNSKIWDVLRFQEEGPDLPWSPYVVDVPGWGGGWSIGSGYGIQFRNANEDFTRLQYGENSGLQQWELDLLNNHQWWKVVLLMPDGAEHELRPLNHASYWGSQDFLRGYFNVKPNGSPMRYYSTDGSYLFATISTDQNWTVYMPDGARIIQTPDGVQRIQDTNGNKIKIFSDANGSHYQDEQTGREIRVTYDPAGHGGQGQYRVWYPTVTGIQHYIEINMGATTVVGKTYKVNDWDTANEMVCQRTEGLFPAQLPVVREIVFPQTEPGQQRKFVFSYNSDTTENVTTSVNWGCWGGFVNYTRAASAGWGELSRVISPPGNTQDSAYADYSYQPAQHSLESADEIAKNSIGGKALHHDGIFETWSYSISETNSSFSAPDGNWFQEQRYCATWGTPNCSLDKAGLAYRITQPFLRTEKHWINLTFSGADVIKPGGVISFNPVVDFEYTTLLDADNNPLKMSAKAFQHDYNGNVTQTKEYDWFDPSLVSRDAEGVPTGIPASATLLRTTDHSHYNQAVDAASANVYAKRSISTGAPLILNAPRQTTVGPSIVRLSYDGQLYDVAPTVGNLTTKQVWVDLESKWITTSNTYGLYGNIATATDGRGKVTQFFYDDATHALPNRVVVDPQNGTSTQTATTVFDYHTGLVTSQTDVNGQVSTIDYTNQLLGTIDPFGRPGVTKSPQVNISGTNHRHRVTTTYLDSARQVIVATDLNAENDKLLKTRTTSDMLGRLVLTESTEDGTNYTISVKNAYLNMGQVTLTSTPMRSTASSTDSWTRVTTDNAGRVIEAATFGGAAQPAWTGTAGAFTGAVTTAYIANFTTVTDQAGKVRRSMVDALGRLTRVDEPDGSGNLGSTTAPVQSTSYAYNVFDNLTTVNQGSQTRTFTYDSLSRLRSAVNPESGTINYQYDDNGNLIVKTDARTDPNNVNKKVSAHYEYDALNRVTRRWYNGSNAPSETIHNDPTLPPGVGATDEVKFYYDTQALPGSAPSYTRGAAVGRLVAQTYGAGSNGDYYAYDVLGRPTLKFQQTGTVNYKLEAAYTLSGAVSSLIYPSNNTITNTFDQAGRLINFSGNLGGETRTYASGNVYSPAGGLLKEQFGTNTAVYHKLHYNSRQQLCDVRASNVNDEWGGELGALVNYYGTPYAHCGSGVDNNGNLLMSQTIINSVYFEDRYTYDSLNRLTAVSEYLNGTTPNGTQEYDYDRWGNRTIKLSSTLGSNKQFTVIPANNRLAVPTGQIGDMQYDGAGNLTNDTYTGAGNRTYDAENKIISAMGGINPQPQLYKYDGSGQRIKRTVDGVETWQVYGFGGELIAEYGANSAAANPQKEYGYRNGQLLITATPPNDRSLSLNGSSAYAQVPNSSSLNISGAITVEAWVKVNSTGAYQDIITRESWGQSGTGGGYELSVTNLGKARLDTYQTPTTYTTVIGSTTISTGVWHHVAGVFDGSQMRVYLDGVLDGTLSTSNAPASGTSSLKIGRTSGGSYFNGLIDEARVSNSAVYSSNFTPQQHLTASGSTKGLWKFDGPTPNDTSGNGNNGSLQGGAVYATDVPTGPAYHSGSFNGSSAYVQVPNSSSLNISGAITVEAWVKVNSTGAYQDIITRESWGQSGTGGGYELSVTNLGKARLDTYQTPTTYTTVIGSTTISTGVWHHVAGVFDGSQMRVYLDGVLDGTFSTSNAPASGTSSLKIGRTSGGSYFNGLIDEARVSNSAVYASNFTPQQHFTPTGSTKGLWKFDSQSPNDASTNGNHGSLQGGATYSNDVPGGGGGGGAGVGPQIQWLVSDHLGTPRMVFDQTGSLANVKRHDYLPFGEELFAEVGGRTVALGYSGSDGVRQQFTLKERDIETGLDYFLARYYSSIQGRFTSTDEFKGGPTELETLGSGDSEKQALVYADITNPQSLNKYQYTLNSPLRYIDPDGRAPQDQFHNRMDHLIRQQLKGEITGEEQLKRMRGASIGGAAGLAVVGAAIAGRHAGAAILLWAARNPDKVQQIATAIQESAGGPPGSISGASMMTKPELSMAQYLAAEGKHVSKNALSTVQGVKTADFSINGVIAELKTLGKEATDKTLKNRIAEGVGQGNGNVLIDARNAARITLDQAQHAVKRVFGADDRLNVVRVVGKDFDITIVRNPN